mgnify:CR=1 FL=1
MNLIQIILWIWVVTFLVDVIWFQINPNFLKDYHKNNLSYFEYSFYIKLMYLITLIVAPFIFLTIVVGEIRGLYVFFTYKWKLKRKLKKLKNKEVEEFLNDELDKIKYNE